ncbi:MAG: hypothetical protein V1728_00560 [Candidatus Micrarchaeota archaeon]
MAPLQKEKDMLVGPKTDSLSVSLPPVVPAGKERKKPAMKNVYSKVDSSERILLSPKARALALERLNEIDKENALWIDKMQIPVRGDGRPALAQEMADTAMKIAVFNSAERDLYLAALNGKTIGEIAVCKDKILQEGKNWNDPTCADGVIKRFERTVSK